MIEQAEDFQSRMTASWKDLAGIIEYCGPYEMNEVMSLMSASGWVLVPSIWWENSPLVIEEAFHSERPVICSNIGGMKEKVTDEVNGLHFRVRDPHDLSRVLERCLREPDLWHQLRQSVRRLPSLHESAAQHRAYYQEAGK
jgi:glycosyltransferase involved in cell wall biosynthesis